LRRRIPSGQESWGCENEIGWKKTGKNMGLNWLKPELASYIAE